MLAGSDAARGAPPPCSVRGRESTGFVTGGVRTMAGAHCPRAAAYGPDGLADPHDADASLRQLTLLEERYRAPLDDEVCDLCLPLLAAWSRCSSRAPLLVSTCLVAPPPAVPLA